MSGIAYELGKTIAKLLEQLDVLIKDMPVEEYNAFWNEYCRGANGEKPSVD